jgi:hypothetical protein
MSGWEQKEAEISMARAIASTPPTTTRACPGNPSEVLPDDWLLQRPAPTSPVRIRITRETSVIRPLPSPILPVRPLAMTAAIFSRAGVVTHHLDPHLRYVIDVVPDPRYTPLCRRRRSPHLRP